MKTKQLLSVLFLAIILQLPLVFAQNVKSFDVASMKPSDPQRGPAAKSTSADALPGGRFVARNVTLGNLVSMAYGVQYNRLSGEPGWFANTYDIDAIAEGAGEQTEAELRPYLKSLLDGRMKLTTHRETREATAYVLTVLASPGIKMKPSVSDGPVTSKYTQPGHFSIQNSTMRQLAYTLSRHPDIQPREVIDETGLAGHFDLELDWRSVMAPDATATVSIFKVVEEQLGLKLTPRKVVEEFLVIDHAEKPSGN